MLNYNDLYELLRKEKYGETLQQLPKNFLNEVSLFLQDKREQSATQGDLFLDSVAKSKKQLENSIAIFKELISRRKKKLLQLAFIATETGIMKRDYETMLEFEKNLFEKFVNAFEEGDKYLLQVLHGKKEQTQERYKLVIFHRPVEQFVDMAGNVIGPFNEGTLLNVETEVASALVSGGKASYVDDEG